MDTKNQTIAERIKVYFDGVGEKAKAVGCSGSDLVREYAGDAVGSEVLWVRDAREIVGKTSKEIRTDHASGFLERKRATKKIETLLCVKCEREITQSDRLAYDAAILHNDRVVCVGCIEQMMEFVEEFESLSGSTIQQAKEETGAQRSQNKK